MSVAVRNWSSFWASSTTTQHGILPFVVVGHRGMGKNEFPSTSTGWSGCRQPVQQESLMENTILSFNTALENGADFVEFDVQVTRDGVPVLFHDDFVMTVDGQKRKIGDMSLQDFSLIEVNPDQALLRGVPDPQPWPAKVVPPLPTLQEVLMESNPQLGFNIEVKFVGHEPSKVGLEEVERVLNPILKVVSEFAGSRKIYFSTFNPDAAIRLKEKQLTYPVFFLTEGGKEIFDDRRMNSIEAAVELCKKYNLDGIVTEVSAILKNESLVKMVKDQNLQLLSYGSLNNIAKSIEIQREANVDGVIVDDVYEMSKVAKCC